MASIRRRYIVRISAFLILSGLFSFSSISLAQDEKWTKKADMPTQRRFFSTSVVNGKIYAIGGDGPGALSTVEEYDPIADKWTKKSNMPTARRELSTATVNGKIYAIGGNSIGGFVGTIPTVEEYDPATDTWTKKADMPAPRTFLSTSAPVVNGKIYVIGGEGKKGETLSTVEEYDPVTNRWTKKADMPIARERLSTVAVDGKIYAIGGWQSLFNPLPTVEEYDPIIDQWRNRAKMPTARVDFSSSVVNGKIYAIGGFTGPGPGQFLTLSTVEEYDPSTNKWEKRIDMPTPRWGLSTSAVKGKIYAIGGDGPVLRSTIVVEEYDTGFSGEAEDVEAKGKLVTSWGKIKSNHENLKEHEKARK